MQPTEEAAVELARRLRNLRQSALGVKITQADLAQALGRSPALISSWERREEPVTPSAEQLTDYATFFSSPRLAAAQPHRVPAETELNDRERATRTVLRDELLALRAKAMEPNGTSLDALASRGPWFYPEFEEEEPLVIVLPEHPATVLAGMPHAQETDLDYSPLARLTDLDALFELYGHIRANNPELRVDYRGASEMSPSDYSGHLVVLGGVDWNPAQRRVMTRIEAPVEQVSEDDPLRRGYFQVTTDGENRSFPPLIATEGGEDVLIEDVGYFFRGPSPYNQHRTVTLCNGMFNRGVQGAVRALTDRTFRDGNAEYLFETFGDADSYSLLFRVAVMEQAALTPDWTAAGTVLHAWSERSG